MRNGPIDGGIPELKGAREFNGNSSQEFLGDDSNYSGQVTSLAKYAESLGP
jgi:hypothetical protein